MSRHRSYLIGRRRSTLLLLGGQRYGGLAMVPGAGASIVRAAAVVPVVLLALFVGLLWLVGLFCNKERRGYVIRITSQVTRTLSPLLHGNLVSEPCAQIRGRQT